MTKKQTLLFEPTSAFLSGLVGGETFFLSLIDLVSCTFFLPDMIKLSLKVTFKLEFLFMVTKN